MLFDTDVIFEGKKISKNQQKKCIITQHAELKCFYFQTLNLGETCPYYKQLYQDLLKSPKVQEFEKENRVSRVFLFYILLQGSHRLEKYLNIQDCLEKSLKIKCALKST